MMCCDPFFSKRSAITSTVTCSCVCGRVFIFITTSRVSSRILVRRRVWIVAHDNRTFLEILLSVFPASVWIHSRLSFVLPTMVPRSSCPGDEFRISTRSPIK